MIAGLKSLARSGLRRMPLLVHQRLVPRRAVVLLYHALGPSPLPHVCHLYPHKSPQEFATDLAWLARHYRMVSYDEIESGAVGSGRPAVHVTFDDGLAACDMFARPLLKRMGIPCTFFITSDFLDNRRLWHRNKASLLLEALVRIPARQAAAFLADRAREFGRQDLDAAAFRRWILALTPADEPRLDALCGAIGVDVAAYLATQTPYLTSTQVRALAADGFTIGGHGRSHVVIGGMPAPDANSEIVASCATARTLSGRVRVPFAFPHSADGVNRAFLRALSAANPDIGLFFNTRGLLTDDPLVVNRVVVDQPPAARGTTNLPSQLKEAYVEAMLWSLRGGVSDSPASLV